MAKARPSNAGAKVSDGGTISALVSDGVGVVGSAALLVVEPNAPQDVALTVRLLADGRVRLSWPANADGFQLESSTWARQLSPLIWPGTSMCPFA